MGRVQRRRERTAWRKNEDVQRAPSSIWQSTDQHKCEEMTLGQGKTHLKGWEHSDRHSHRARHGACCQQPDCETHHHRHWVEYSGRWYLHSGEYLVLDRMLLQTCLTADQTVLSNFTAFPKSDTKPKTYRVFIIFQKINIYIKILHVLLYLYCFTYNNSFK